MFGYNIMGKRRPEYRASYTECSYDKTLSHLAEP